MIKHYKNVYVYLGHPLHYYQEIIYDIESRTRTEDVGHRGSAGLTFSFNLLSFSSAQDRDRDRCDLRNIYFN